MRHFQAFSLIHVLYFDLYFFFLLLQTYYLFKFEQLLEGYEFVKCFWRGRKTHQIRDFFIKFFSCYVDLYESFVVILLFYIKNRHPERFIMSFLLNVVEYRLKFIPFFKMRVRLDRKSVYVCREITQIVSWNPLKLLNEFIIWNVTQAFQLLIGSGFLWQIQIRFVCFIISSYFLIPLNFTFYFKIFGHS